MDKKNQNIKKSILSYFKLKKEGKGVDISPKPIRPIPQINYPQAVLSVPEKKKKKKKNYISPELVVLLDGLTKKINSIAGLPVKQAHKNIIRNNITNKYETNPTKEINKYHTTTVQKTNPTPKEIKVPVMLERILHVPDNKVNQKPKSHKQQNESNITKTEKIINNINKILITKSNPKNKTVNINHNINKTESKNDNIPDINKNHNINKTESKNDNIPNINKIQNIQNTNNTIENSKPNNTKEIPLLSTPPIIVNNTKESTNTNRVISSKVLNRNTIANRSTNKNSYSISRHVIKKILSNEVKVPQIIPAFQGGGAVDPVRGAKGTLAVLGEKEREYVLPKSTVDKAAATQANIGKTTNNTASSLASKSLDQNAAMKIQKDNNPNESKSEAGEQPIINATAMPAPAAPQAPAGGMGGSTKSVTSMRAQTMYPRWRQSMG